MSLPTPGHSSPGSLRTPSIAYESHSDPETFYSPQESYSRTSFENNLFSTNGIVLPIDDNEYAVIHTTLNQQRITYEIFTNVPNQKNSLNPVRNPTHQRSVSLSSDIKVQSSTSVPDPRSRSNSNRSNGHKSKSASPSSKNQSPDRRSTASNCNFEPENDPTFSYGDNYAKNDAKDKPSSIFDTNGLFIKKDHPLFVQTFSRKVFIGGLPRDISIDNIQKRFAVFGPHHVDWPNRDHEKTPPNGFAFLHFEHSSSVEKLFDSVSNAKIKNRFTMSSNSVRAKDVEVKFWRMSDCECMVKPRDKINPFLTVFVGALPRTTTASELADFMQHAFSHVAYAAIDVDVVYGYPKGWL